MFDVVNYTLLLILALLFLYPLYFTVIASFSEPREVASGNVMFWIKDFTLDCYNQVFKAEQLWRGYGVTIVYTVFGTMLSLFLTIPAAYALSKKTLWGRGLITTYFLIIMYFSGGLLPTYLVVKNLGLLNQPYTLIVMGAFSVYNMVVARTYFQTSIPESLYEAAEIDGCSQFGRFFRIALPLAKPIIAVITLYYAVGKWNEYYNCLVYINDSKYYSLQMVVRNIINSGANLLSNAVEQEMTIEQAEYAVRRKYIAEAMKYSVILISSLPMLIVYPFIQKYFVKGVMVGSIKG